MPKGKPHEYNTEDFMREAWVETVPEEGGVEAVQFRGAQGGEQP